MITTIILFILGIITIKDIIAMTGIINPNWPYSYIFYGKFSRVVIIQLLKELGYTKQQSGNIVNGWDKVELDRKNKNCYETNKSKILIAIIINHIYKFEVMTQYGGSPPIQSQYYINTMEAIHDVEHRHLEQMCDQFCSLIYDNIIKNEMPTPDFIIVPKGGNPILANAIAQQLEIILVVIKQKSENSRALINDKNRPQDYFNVNIEGGNILKKISEVSSKKMSGIAIDCNTSGGSQMIDAMSEFNKIKNLLKLNINDITDAYVLFKIDSKNKYETDKKFTEHGYKLYRYFDISEEIKNELYEVKGQQEYIDYYAGENMEKINIIYNKIKTEK